MSDIVSPPHPVSRRTREIGIHLALGADRGRIESSEALSEPG